MPIARSYLNNNEIVSFVDELKEIPNQYGWFNGSGIFQVEPIATYSVAFDRTENSITLPPLAARGPRAPSTGGRKATTTFNLGTSFYKESEFVTGQDIQEKRMPGTQEAEALERVISEKLELGSQRFDQMQEYLKSQAIKGLVVDTAGNTLTNMFTEFGLTQTTISFGLDDATTDVHQKVRQLKTAVTKNAKTGMRTGPIMVPCDPLFFDKLKGHQKVREDFMYYQNSGKQILRDDLAEFESYGIVSYFEFQGVMFFAYDATFTLSNGSTANAIEDNTGYSIVKGVSGSYKHYAGPNDHLSGANQAGSPLYAFQYRDPKDQFHEIEFEAAPLIVLRKPQFSVKVTA